MNHHGPAIAEAILDVDLLRFERGDNRARQAVVDGVRRSLASGFVYASAATWAH